jgi:hypothetical protein
MTDERTIAKFLRGLTIGAIFGAVLAGSRIWARWSGRGRAATKPDRRPDRKTP